VNVTGGPLCAVLLPPQSSPGSRPPWGEGREQSKPQRSKHGHPRRGTPTAGHARKRMPTAAYPRKSCSSDGQRPTAHRPHQHPPRIDGVLATPTARTHPDICICLGGSNTIESHCTSGHRPDLNVVTARDAPSKSARRIERCAKDAQKVKLSRALPRNGAQITGPSAPSKRAHPSNGRALSQKRARAKRAKTQRTRGPPKGATRRARANHFASRQSKRLDEKGPRRNGPGGSPRKGRRPAGQSRRFIQT
jgi:hypothetical protein